MGKPTSDRMKKLQEKRKPDPEYNKEKFKEKERRHIVKLEKKKRNKRKHFNRRLKIIRQWENMIANCHQM